MTKGKSQLSTEPYKGTRDFYPEDMYVQNYIFNTMRKVAERYGYVEYGASVLEPTALYQAKSGEEIVNEQTYSFADRGGRDVTLRPEMTPTIARMVASKRKELAFPLRWYSIPNLFRYERPQRGRLREHWQLNVDIFGTDSIEADAEVISVAVDIMKAFGAKPDNFVVLLNNRKLTNFLTKEFLQLDTESAYKLTKLIDRKNKMEEEVFLAQARELVGDKISQFMQVMKSKAVEDLPNELRENDGAKELKKLEELLNKCGITNIQYDPSVIRGFDYYTGTVFELFDTNPANRRSLFGGGRYDDLVSIFGADKVPGVGFGMGDVTMRDYIETYGLIPSYTSSAVLYICCLGPEFISFADELASYLRQKNINVAVDYTDRKIGAQIKTAEKQGVPYVVCLGEEESKTKRFKLKTLATREEKEVSWNDLPEALRS